MSAITRRHRGSFVCGVGVVLLASALAAQEHGYTAADVENGGRLFQSSCAGCHGTTGDGVPGLDLRRGQFRRGTSDAEIAAIIRAGIPGTTMPPSGFSEAQSTTIVAYLRSMASNTTASGRGGAPGPVAGRGDVVRGKSLFDGKGACGSCHRVNGVGPRTAPDLSDVGAIRNPSDLQTKLLDPNALVRPANRYVQLVKKDGAPVSGRLLNQDTFSIQILDSNERLLSLSKSDLRDITFIRTSPMPSYRDKLSAQDVTDLVAYLFSLKGFRP